MLPSNRQKVYINHPHTQIIDLKKTTIFIYLTGFRLGIATDTAHVQGYCRGGFRVHPLKKRPLFFESFLGRVPEGRLGEGLFFRLN